MGLFGRKKKSEGTGSVEPKPTGSLPTPPATDDDGLRSVDDHLDYLLSLVEELPPFGQHIGDSLGLSLCEEIIADLDIPQFDTAATTGYAVRARDINRASDDDPVSLAVVGEVQPGEVASDDLAPGTAVLVHAGAPLPREADTVVALADTDEGTVDVQIRVPAGEGSNIRARGEDIADQTALLAPGDVIGPRTVSLLATIGIDSVLVRPRPRVVVLSTGSQLVEAGLDLSDPGQAYDSNSHLLAACARDAGAQVFRVGLVDDDPDTLRQTVSDQLVRADLILTTGGVSQSDYELVQSVLPDIGLTDFCEVAMSPGRPQGFGLIGEDEIPMILLPGNPVSAFVSFEVFVRPVIRKMMGVHPLHREQRRAYAATVVRSAPGKRQYLRAFVKEDQAGRRLIEIINGDLPAEMTRANALAVIDADRGDIAAGDPVPYLPLD